MNGFETPVIASTRSELAAALKGTTGKRGLVMTMGALHEGHLELVRQTKPQVDHLVATVFLNPLQFAPGEDFHLYPRDLEGDIAKLSSAGVDLIFTPDPETMYPHGDPALTIDAGRLGGVLEGKTRPTHFSGVCQVVAKMFNLVSPDLATFGQKDAQQLAILKQLVKDLDYPVEILSVPIFRDTDGVALSSRNANLSPSEREQARALYQTLQYALQTATMTGSAAAVQEAAETYLKNAPGVKLDYASLVNPQTLEPVAADYKSMALLLLAAWVGPTRLIDNTRVDLSC